MVFSFHLLTPPLYSPQKLDIFQSFVQFADITCAATAKEVGFFFNFLALNNFNN